MGRGSKGPRPFFSSTLSTAEPTAICKVEEETLNNRHTRKREMEGDPREFRHRALTCARLALVSPIPDTRRAYAKLAASWLRLASDLESGSRRHRFKRRSSWNPLRGRVVQPLSV
jgi:hypothetical protein